MATQFDFDTFNNATKGAGQGLKLHLAIQMLKDVDYSMYRYDNPLQSTLSGIINELKEVQIASKAQAAARAARTE